MASLPLYDNQVSSKPSSQQLNGQFINTTGKLNETLCTFNEGDSSNEFACLKI